MSVDRTAARKNAYFQTPHSLFEDPRYSAIVGDPVLGWTLMRMAHDADRIWPAHPALPRWAEQRALDYLVGVGLVKLLPDYLFTIPRLDEHRAKVAEDASRAGQASTEGAARDKSGHFAPRSAPTTVGPTPPTNAPATETKTKKKKNTKSEDERSRVVRGNPSHPSLAHSDVPRANGSDAEERKASSTEEESLSATESRRSA